MRTQVALSGERIDPRLPGHVDGVGLLRSEYVLRRFGRYLGDTEAQSHLQAYAKSVLDRFQGKPVWYRFCDAPSNEINMLEGNDAYIVEEFPTVGIRGMRRAMSFLETFVAEFQLVADLAHQYPNLHVVFPYVSDIREVELGLRTAVQVGFTNRTGMMLETPASLVQAREFADLGIDLFVVGMNDLSSLVTGAGRGTGYDDHFHPAVIKLITEVRETLADCELSVAGYHSPEFTAVAEEAGFDNLVAHYSALEGFIGPEVRDFDEIDFMAEFKQHENRKRLHRWSTDLARQAESDDGVGLQGVTVTIEEL